MSEHIFNKIQDFILRGGWGYSLPFFKRITLTEQTRVKEDLKINGDDADRFLIDFGKEFNVDITKFKIDEYFDDEGDPILPTLIRVIGGKKNKETKQLTLQDLERAVVAGRLDEEVINRKS